MYYYHAYGLNISSDIEFAPLAKLHEHCADITIRKAEVSPEGIDKPDDTALYYQARTDMFWLDVPIAARFLITDGQNIEYQPYDSAHDDLIILYLMQACVGIILLQREYLVLQGAAICFGETSSIFLGNSGAGKSTLASGFYYNGLDVISDGLCVIDNQGRAVPGYSYLKLWRNNFNHLKCDPRQLHRVHPDVEKYYYPLQEICTTPMPVSHAFILQSWNEDEVKKQSITGINKFTPLQNYSYRQQYHSGLGLKSNQMRKSTRFANEVKLTRIIRPQSNYRVSEWMQLMLDEANYCGDPPADSFNAELGG